MSELPTITPRPDPRVEVHPRVLFGLLVAALVATDLVIVSVDRIRRHDWPDPIAATCLGLFFGQTSLLAVWFVWGRTNIATRTMVVAATTAAQGFGVNTIVGDGTPMWIGGLLMLVAWQALAGWIARFFCWQLTTGLAGEFQKSMSEARAQNVNSGGANTRRQFSVWGIMSLMTATGVVITVARQADVPGASVLHGLLIFGSLGALNALICGAILSWQSAKFYVPWTILVGVVIGILFPYLVGDGQQHWAYFLWMCVVQSTTLLACMGVVRLEGFRLRRV